MNFLIGSKEEFNDFVGGIKPEDRVGILTHTDLDGITSAIFLEKILESKKIKIEHLQFLSYKNNMFRDISETLLKKRITKVFITDLAADLNDINDFEYFRARNDCFLIDHHLIAPDLKNKRNIIKTRVSDCVSLIMYELGKDYFDVGSWDWLICASAFSDFAYKNCPENLKFIQERYPDITLENIRESEVKKIDDMISSAIVYSKGNLKLVYDLVKEKNFSVLNKMGEEVQKETKKSIERYEKEAEYYPDKGLYFAYFTPKYSVGSYVSTAMSIKDSDKVYVFARDGEKGMINISARNQSHRVDMNDLMKKGINGLKGASGGGHVPAAAALIKKQDLETFKKNILG